uniref:MAZ protein n=1 Tax=Dromaius novaehollandiae TaxID=8790 RepID=A0A8C4J9N9_DRONO
MLSAAYISDHMKVHSQGPAHVCELCNKGASVGRPWGGRGAGGGRAAPRGAGSGG